MGGGEEERERATCGIPIEDMTAWLRNILPP